MPEIITRAEARARGLKRYFTGKPCKHGHVAERQTGGKGCLECARETDHLRQFDPETREARLETSRKSGAKRRTNPETRGAELERVRKYAAKRRVTPEGQAYAMQYYYNIPQWLAPYISEHKATGNCPGCGVKFGHPKSPTRACIDHDHDTGLVRMIVCNQCNTVRLCRCDDGRNPDALLLAAGLNAKRTGRKARERALIQMRLAALLIDHYKGVEVAPAVGRMLAIPLPTQ